MHTEIDRFTDKRSMNIDIRWNIGKFPFVYSSVSRTYSASNINIDMAIVTMVVGLIQMKTLKLVTGTK